MSTITTLPSAINASKSVIDTNFSNLNIDKLEATDLKTVNGNSLLGSGDIVISGGGSVATDTIWDAKGDLAGGTGANTASRLAVGTNGQVLVADSAEATGMKWATATGTGDMLASTYDPAGGARQVSFACTTQTAITDYTFTGSESRDSGYLVTTASNRTVNISPDLFTTGYEVTICKGTNNANTVTLDAQTGNNINGTQTFVLTQYNETVTLLKDGADTWKIKSHYYPISGTNTGDQASIVGITGTKAQFDTAVTDGNILYVGDIVSASTTAQGIVELATTAEINTGTDTTRAMPVDQFVASNRNVRYFDIYAIEKATNNAVGTNIAGSIECPFTGTITEIGAYVETAGVTGASVWDVNKNGTTIMTTNKLSIDSAEVSTRTSATPPTLTTTAITAGDLITIDTDSISTTAPKGLHVRIGIRLT